MMFNGYILFEASSLLTSLITVAEALLLKSGQLMTL